MSIDGVGADGPPPATNQHHPMWRTLYDPLWVR
jgi:hypothetical protein